MSTPQQRLADGYYNSGGFSGSNPGGLSNGGHVQNFPAALADIGVVAIDVGVKAGQAQTYAQSSAADAASASQNRQKAEQAAAAAATSAGSINLTNLAKTNASNSFNSVQTIRKAGDANSGNWAPALCLWLSSFAPSIAFEDRSGSSSLNGLLGLDSNVFKWQRDSDVTGEFRDTIMALNMNTQVLTVGVGTVFTSANDGSGSGLDADMLRGQLPAVGGSGGTIASRDANGRSGFAGVDISSGGSLSFNSGPSLSRRSTTEMTLAGGLYLDGNLSAAAVTERSDRMLKADIQPLRLPQGRLQPVLYRLIETGEERLGFIAQDVAAVQPLAVSSPLDAPMEVRLTGVIAHLAAQLNDALDRIQQLERR